MRGNIEHGELSEDLKKAWAYLNDQDVRKGDRLEKTEDGKTVQFLIVEWEDDMVTIEEITEGHGSANRFPVVDLALKLQLRQSGWKLIKAPREESKT